MVNKPNKPEHKSETEEETPPEVEVDTTDTEQEEEKPAKPKKKKPKPDPEPEEEEPTPEEEAEPESQEEEKPKKGKSKSTGVSIEFQQDPKTSMDSFVHRRRMAWTALFAMLGLALLAIFKLDPTHISAYDGMFGWVFSTLSAIVLAYMGVTTFSYSTWLKSKK